MLENNKNMQSLLLLCCSVQLISLGVGNNHRSPYQFSINLNRHLLPYLELVNTNNVASFVTVDQVGDQNQPQFLVENSSADIKKEETKSRRNRRRKSRKPKRKNLNFREEEEEAASEEFFEAKVANGGLMGTNGSVGRNQGQSGPENMELMDLRKISDPRNKFKLTGAVKVSGGNDAPRGLVPWQVSLMRDNVHRCGGSLFATDPLATVYDTVLTAAHCVFDKDNNVFDASVFTVLGGTVLLSSITEVGSKHHTSKVCRVIPHPSYRSNDGEHFLDDIAVLKLSTPFRRCEEVDAIQVQTSLAPENISATAYISGWGEISGGNFTNRLQVAKVPITSDEMCAQSLYALNRRFDPRTQICAGGYGEIDVCSGDSGGPLVCKNESDEWAFLCGIVSYGAPCTASEQIRKPFPGVYTMPQGYLGWIKQQEELPRCLG